MTKSSLARRRQIAHKKDVGPAPLSGPATPSFLGDVAMNGISIPAKLASALFGLALVIGGVAGSAAPALAAPCKDAKGKFVKCPPKPVAKKAPCKDAKGRFTKCK